MNLPVVGPVVKALKDAVEERAAILEKQKLETQVETQRNRIQYKIARAENQAGRKRWAKRQSLQHTYGGDDGEDDALLVAEADSLISDLGGEDRQLTTISGKKCRCDSFLYQRTSHHACPLNKASHGQKQDWHFNPLHGRGQVQSVSGVQALYPPKRLF